MSSSDNPWDKLEAAIETYLTEIEQPGLLLDWVLVTHKVSANEDGSNDASTTYVGSEHQTQYRTLGLLEHAKVVVKMEIAALMEGGWDGNDDL